MLSRRLFLSAIAALPVLWKLPKPVEYESAYFDGKGNLIPGYPPVLRDDETLDWISRGLKDNAPLGTKVELPQWARLRLTSEEKSPTHVVRTWSGWLLCWRPT